MRLTARCATVAVASLLLAGSACNDEPATPKAAKSPAPVVSASTPAPTPTEVAAPSTSPADLPPITVATPAASDEVSSPALVSGTADVFEATVSMRILDASGKVLVRDFTTATCGTGCRGEYEKSLPFEVDAAQDGTIEVWWDSPKDGSRQDVVKVPVTLLP
jgi:Immunoglobulin-like domain of bacterial spore germination